MPERSPRLSIIVVTFNEREVVARSLPALLEQLEDGDELIVADNRSSDGTPELVAEIAPRALVLRMPSNDGYMPACNAAARRATGDVLMTLDADAVVAPGFLAAMRGPAVDGSGWAAWQGLVTMDEGRLVNTSGGVSHFTGISWAGDIEQPAVDASSEPHEVAFLTGVCLTITREAWEIDPGFPDDYFLYFDDVDFSWRARLYGGRIGCRPDARVDHLYDFRRARTPKWRLLERNRWTSILRTYPPELLALVLPALVATDVALLAIAARDGWGADKLRATGDVARRLPRTLRERRAIQARRAISARDFAAYLTPDLSSPYLGGAADSRLLRSLLRAYWALVLRLLPAR